MTKLEKMRIAMKKYFDSFTPEAYCKMLEEKYGFKEIVDSKENEAYEYLNVSTPSCDTCVRVFSEESKFYGVAA